jgi:XapX domain-containing protein
VNALTPYLLSFLVGLGVGGIYALSTVRSPAPPLIALLGLLGILIGEQAVSKWRERRSPPVSIAGREATDPPRSDERRPP